MGEFHFADNAISLNVGIFDSFDEPDVALWYRRYIRLAPPDVLSLTPYAGVGVAGLLNIHQPSKVIGMSGIAAGFDWTFWSTFSLCVEGTLLVEFWPLPVHVAIMPALSLRVGL